MAFKEVKSDQNFPELEQEILKFWQENKIFEKSIQNRSDDKLYSFYDGPPFATGTPHYGHLVASTMKDVVPRYFTMKGYKVPRVWGWDCHGLPIENIAEQKLGIKHKNEIEQLGVEKFNNVCREEVLKYVTEWEKIIPRLGRWVDMQNAYKTMDLSYMESVWWVFKSLWDQDLIYESYRSMYICPRCETTLSQSEVTEGYKTIKDLSAIAEFELVDEPNTFVLAWTTTPWTLLANVALAVGEDIQYVKIEKKDEGVGELVRFIMAKDRLEEIFKEDKYSIIDEFCGSDLVGKKYKPLFDDYAQNGKLENCENGWQILTADFVTTQEGTGIVHIAPAFGEDDLNLAKEKKLPFIQHIGMNGIIKEGYGHFSGMNVKDIDDVQKTDVELIKDLASRNLLFSKEQYEHSYPHCWRCETPLLNFATTSWFVKIESLKTKAMDLAKEINWSPKHMKEGRFGKWLEGARDWSISRQRYWASVIPLWRCQCGEIKVVGSIKELEELSGQKITDLHKDKIDLVTIKCEKCGQDAHRIADVLDTWFDSGSMPYAQKHFPFENKENFEKTFPAEFIGEGQDQTRAWFYYLHMISTAISKQPAYKNVLVNGIVLASDGKKMSKRLQNYPDPLEVIDKYGADALRLYLLTSPVMQAENLNFVEKDLAQINTGFLRMLNNSYSFFVLYANTDQWQARRDQEKSNNVLDRWILSELNQLVMDMTKQMDNYELTKASRLLMPFVDNLSNWYIRRSRKRRDNDFYSTLREVLFSLSKVLAPFVPFISESIYQNLKIQNDPESVHLCDWPKPGEIDNELILQMQKVRDLVEQAHAQRAEKKIRVRQPLSKVTIKSDLNTDLQEILSTEVNVKQILVDNNLKDEIVIDLEITPELKEEGIKNDLVRQIQDVRKKAQLNSADKVEVIYQADEKLSEIIQKYQKELANETNLTKITSGEVEFISEVQVDGQSLRLGVKK